jgi:hypothetical protein
VVRHGEAPDEDIFELRVTTQAVLALLSDDLDRCSTTRQPARQLADVTLERAAMRRVSRRDERDPHGSGRCRCRQARQNRRAAGLRSNAIVRNTRPPSRTALRLLMPWMRLLS